MKQTKYVAVITQTGMGGRDRDLSHFFERLSSSQMNDLFNDKNVSWWSGRYHMADFYPIPDDFPIKYHHIFLNQYCGEVGDGDQVGGVQAYGYVYLIEKEKSNVRNIN